MYELVSPVNFRTVLKYLGILLMGMGLVTIVPFTIILMYFQHTAAVLYGVAGGIIIGLGYALYRFLPDEDLQWKEAMVITALVFPVAALISAVPFSIVEGMSIVDAYFEAVSGVTTTGLSVAPVTVGPLFLFARSWLQWIGGIGILIIVLSLITPGGISASRLFGAGIGERKIRPNVLGTATLLFEVYLVISLISFILLFLAGMSPFDALCQALSSVSTGGFSTRPDSIAGFGGWAIPVVIIISCILGSVNFEVFTRMSRNPLSLVRSAQFRWFLAIGVLGSLLLAFTLLDAGGNLFVVVPRALFQGFSSLTTAGFSTMNISTVPDSSKVVMSVLMWIGGSMGSTAGGIKILRVITLFSIIRLVFIRFFVPRETVTTLKIGNTPVSEDQVYHLVTFLFLYFLVLVVSALFFMLSGYPMADSVFETSSALGTVGLSTGITGAALALPLKVVLIIDMLLGRIEIIPLILLIFPRTWVKRAG
jgi:trk system potassium uptake protein TrkH